MTSLLAPALVLGGGGLAAYLFLRSKAAEAAAHPMPTMPPNASSSETTIVIPANAIPKVNAPMLMQITTPARPSVNELPMIAPSAPFALTGRWGWPVPRFEGRAPVISDGYGSPRGGMRHAGVDIMFARIARDPFPIGSANGSKLFVMPDAWPAVAAADGVLWSAGHTARGYAVVIDHGNVATFYQHLSTLLVPETKPPAKGTPRTAMIQIKAGQPLGVIGGDPLDPAHLKHLHFELWRGGPSSAIDPASLMRTWQIFEPREVVPLFPNARNAKAKRDSDLVQVRGYERRFPGTALNPPR